jgi:hypothetical protein
MRIFGILFLAFGLAMLACAAWLNEREKTFYATALRADGRVIEMIARHAGRAGSTWAPRVEFTDTAGHVVRFVSGVASKPPAYRVGESVRIAYSPNNSERAKIDSFFGRWGLVMIPGGIGAVFLLIGTGCVITARRQPSRSPA